MPIPNADTRHAVNKCIMGDVTNWVTYWHTSHALQFDKQRTNIAIDCTGAMHSRKRKAAPQVLQMNGATQ